MRLCFALAVVCLAWTADVFVCWWLFLGGTSTAHCLHMVQDTHFQLEWDHLIVSQALASIEHPPDGLASGDTG